ncbi:MAG: hypothetical protein Ct9H90mP16_17270 [Candidatus Poseidoniales archaeon]|nr:MAG: hypothetical protein Ct9H90mP16_17270 [Candidatus Poseidoniales archaeon]
MSTTVFDSICYKRCLSWTILDAKGEKRCPNPKATLSPPGITSTGGCGCNPLVHGDCRARGIRSSLIRTGSARLTPRCSSPLELLQIPCRLSRARQLRPNPNECPVESRSSLDRGVLSKLNSFAADYQLNSKVGTSTRPAEIWKNFVVNDLSNWYVRRSRADCGMKATVRQVGLPTYATRRPHHALPLDCPGVAVHGRCHSPQLDRESVHPFGLAYPQHPDLNSNLACNWFAISQRQVARSG